MQNTYLKKNLYASYTKNSKIHQYEKNNPIKNKKISEQKLYKWQISLRKEAQHHFSLGNCKLIKNDRALHTYNNG